MATIPSDDTIRGFLDVTSERVKGMQKDLRISKLFTTKNPKTLKGLKNGYITSILHLSPQLSGGAGNVCPNATPGCIASCLNTAGRGGIFKAGETTNVIQDARKRRTQAFFTRPEAFKALLAMEIAKEAKKAEIAGMKLAVRLNGTSDLNWLHHFPKLFSWFKEVQFYDYTKHSGIAHDFIDGKLPSNYHLTFSASETNQFSSLVLANKGMSVAVVFGKAIPMRYRLLSMLGHKDYSRRVVDGDASDLRFLDPSGVIVGLRAKGKARKDTTGFVVRDY